MCINSTASFAVPVLLSNKQTRFFLCFRFVVSSSYEPELFNLIETGSVGTRTGDVLGTAPTLSPCRFRWVVSLICVVLTMADGWCLSELPLLGLQGEAAAAHSILRYRVRVKCLHDIMVQNDGKATWRYYAIGWVKSRVTIVWYRVMESQGNKHGIAEEERKVNTLAYREGGGELGSDTW